MGGVVPGRGAGFPRFHVIVGDSVVGSGDYRQRLRAVAEVGGGLALHLRARRTPARQICEVAAWLAGAADALVVVNDRTDIALAAGAGGVHLREDSLPAGVVRAIAGDGLVVGRSIHAARQAAGIRGGRLDYLIMGAAYETASHPGRAPVGPEAIGSAAALADVPVLAIGGVTPARVPELVARGAYGIVVKSGVWGRECPARAASRYLEALWGEGLK